MILQGRCFFSESRKYKSLMDIIFWNVWKIPKNYLLLLQVIFFHARIILIGRNNNIKILFVLLKYRVLRYTLVLSLDSPKCAFCFGKKSTMEKITLLLLYY